MRIYCICGKAQNGKDTCAQGLKKIIEANSDKKVLIAHYGDLVKYVASTFFGWNGVKDEKGREVLQRVGTDIVRTQNPDYWVDFIISILKMIGSEFDYVLIPDTRFPNEINKLKEAGFDVRTIRVIRPGFDNGLTDEQKAHISETALDNFNVDVTLYNNTTIENFEAILNLMLIAREGIGT